MRLLLIVLGILMRTVNSQRPTPCPSTFLYEDRDIKSDRWYGQITYSSPKNITGLWFHVTLDRSADLLGNWFGQITTVDNTVYVIRNPEFQLVAGIPLTIRLFVKFNLARAIPSLDRIKLNGNVICSKEEGFKPTNSKPDFIQLRPTESSITKKSEDIKSLNNPITSLSADSSDTEIDSDPPGDFEIAQLFPQSRIGAGPKGRKSSKCGVIAPRDTRFVPNGDDTWPGKWPWHGALYRTRETNLAYICGGTLITEEHVILPAHCVTKYHTNRVNQPNNFLVVLGKYNLNRFGPEVQQRSVSEIFVHPEYNHSVYVNDIAVLKLSKTIKVTNFVKPCCLWEDKADSIDIQGKNGTIVGWGLDKTHKLLQTEMTVVPTEYCFFPQSTLDRNYCAEFKDAHSACKVKSIGGMVFPKVGSDGEEVVWQIRGINIVSEIQASCNTTYSKIFTDVAKFTPWIKGIISDSESGHDITQNNTNYNKK